MSKKKKSKKNKTYYDSCIFDSVQSKSKKDLRKEFNRAINEIENERMYLFEKDKKNNKKHRSKINKKQKEFYTDMSSLKARKKLAKKWEKTGLLDTLIELLNNTAPLVKTLAKIVCVFIISFLSITAVQHSIKPDTLDKIMKVFDLASSV